MPPTQDTKPIGLAELINRVKQELLSQEYQKADSLPLLAVEKVELEVAVSVSRAGEAGINIQVINLGGGKSRQDAQTVRVTLVPLWTKDELLKELYQSNPELFDKMKEQSKRTLKGNDQEDTDFPQ